MIKTIYIVGPAESGKSSFAVLLADALENVTVTGWPVQDTSRPLVRWLAQIHAVDDRPGEMGAPPDAWYRYILANKPRFRPQLVALANIAREILPYALVARAEDAGGRIVTGLRSRKEFGGGALVSAEHMLEFSQRAKVEGRIVIYVDRRGVKSVEDGFDAAFYSALAHYRVVNSDSILSNEGLSYQAQLLAEKLLKECA